MSTDPSITFDLRWRAFGQEDWQHETVSRTAEGLSRWHALAVAHEVEVHRSVLDHAAWEPGPAPLQLLKALQSLEKETDQWVSPIP